MRLKTLARTATATATTALVYRRFLRQPILTWGATAEEPQRSCRATSCS